MPGSYQKCRGDQTSGARNGVLKSTMVNPSMVKLGVCLSKVPYLTGKAELILRRMSIVCPFRDNKGGVGTEERQVHTGAVR